MRIYMLVLLFLPLWAFASEEYDVEAVMSKAIKEWHPENEYWYEGAAMLKEPLARDEPWAKYYLAWLYNYGAGGYPQDYKRAHDLTLEAANAGYARAMFNLAIQLESDTVLSKKNLPEALKWYKRGALAGSSRAAGRVAEAYRNGDLGLDVDIEEAEKWEVIKQQCED